MKQQRKVTLKGGPADGQNMVIEGDVWIVKVPLIPKAIPVFDIGPMPEGIYAEAATYIQSSDPFIFIHT